MKKLMSAVIRYEISTGENPNRLEDLERIGLAKPSQFADQWGRRFTYNRADGLIRSAGPDGTLGNSDDFAIDHGLQFAQWPARALRHDDLAALE